MKTHVEQYVEQYSVLNVYALTKAYLTETFFSKEIIGTCVLPYVALFIAEGIQIETQQHIYVKFGYVSHCDEASAGTVYANADFNKILKRNTDNSFVLAKDVQNCFGFYASEQCSKEEFISLLLTHDFTRRK